MRKAEKIGLAVSSLILALSVTAGILELFGLSLCAFGVPLHQYLALPICLSAVPACVLLLRAFPVPEKGEGRGAVRLLHGACIALCVLLVLFTAVAALMSRIHYVGSITAPDKTYKLFYAVSQDGEEPTVHLYRRYSPFWMRHCNSAVLYNSDGDLSGVEAEWEDTYCRVLFSGYPEDTQGAEHTPETLSRRLYYESTE